MPVRGLDAMRLGDAKALLEGRLVGAQLGGEHGLGGRQAHAVAPVGGVPRDQLGSSRLDAIVDEDPAYLIGSMHLARREKDLVATRAQNDEERAAVIANGAPCVVLDRPGSPALRA
jgi:hypothetical protein